MCSKAQKSEHEGDWYGKGLNFNWAAKFTNLDKWYGVKYIWTNLWIRSIKYQVLVFDMKKDNYHYLLIFYKYLLSQPFSLQQKKCWMTFKGSCLT